MIIKKSLKKELNVWHVYAIAAGAMISSGLFILPSIIYKQVGSYVWLIYLLAGLMAIPAMFAKAELSTAMPKSGGSYFFIERSLGSIAGTIGGLASWFELSLKSAFALIGISFFSIYFYPDIDDFHIKLIAVSCVFFFTSLNIISVKSSGKLQLIIVLLLIIIMFLFIAVGFFKCEKNNFDYSNNININLILASSGLVFISFGGLTKVASIAGELKDPCKDLVKGMFSAFFSVLLIYILTTFITNGILDHNTFYNSTTPLSDAGRVLSGSAGFYIMTFAALLAFVSTGNAGIMAASRFPMAMSQDRLLPEFLKKINSKFKTPHNSILTTALFMTCAILFLDLVSLVKVASTIKIILFILEIIAAIIMKESHLINYHPTFKTPLYPWIYIFGIGFYILFLLEMGLESIITTVLFFTLCIVWHFLYVKKLAMRKSAIIHVVERIIDKELAKDSLNKELRTILMERDSLLKDDFYNLVSKSELFIRKKSITSMRLNILIAKKICQDTNCDFDTVLKTLFNNHKLSSSIVKPGISIPHLIIPGNNIFKLYILKNINGIIYPENEIPVNAIFVIAGSLDKRKKHLNTLSSIAKNVSKPDFLKKWNSTCDEELLKDILRI